MSFIAELSHLVGIVRHEEHTARGNALRCWASPARIHEGRILIVEDDPRTDDGVSLHHYHLPLEPTLTDQWWARAANVPRAESTPL
jgi:hypothetical protein